MEFIITTTLIILIFINFCLLQSIKVEIDTCNKKIMDFKNSFLNCYKHLSDDNTIINDNITSLIATINRQNEENITTY